MEIVKRPDTTCAKEPTLRSAIQRCDELFFKQRDLLESQFRRTCPKIKCESEKKPETPMKANVLDQCIDNLTSLANMQEELIKFTEIQIIRKV